MDKRTFDTLKDLGSGKPAPGEIVRLYRQAFDEYGSRALWSLRRLDRPTITQALAISESLRRAGNLEARALAVQIERACRAAL
ncbi:MAG TPA: hypothetical protein VG271_20090 [Beijerinckiaceae bacterium]|jgi:hypothetical protein|nr:hypothetical protein [Beijerinckiaceae bacterium]